MPERLLALLLCLTTFFCQAQDLKKTERLQQQFKAARTDAARIAILSQLADHYYAYRLEKQADSILQKQLALAEVSHNNELIFASLFGNSISNLPNWVSIETAERTLKFIEQGLHFAKEMGRDDYAALAYIRKADLLRKRGQYDNALQQATLAFSSLGLPKADSVYATLNLELADIYLAKNDAVTAYKNLNTAFDVALTLKNVPLQSDAYHHYAALYKTLGDTDAAKENLVKSLELNTAAGYQPGLLNDYIDLARLTDLKEYIDKALALSDSLDLDYQRIYSKKLLFSYYMVVEKNSALALHYLYANDDLRQSYQNVGDAYYNWTLGNVYNYSGQPDSAVFYYHKAEPQMEKLFDIPSRLSIYRELGASYQMRNQPVQAISYLEQALAVAKQLEDITAMAGAAQQLSQLYATTGDYKKAFDLSSQYIVYRDAVQQRSSDRKVALLGVERENRQRQKEAAEIAAATERERNLQYMAITIAIAVLFFVMVVVGSFPVSRFTIKALSYFAFICLFEFIVLLVDSALHHATHGEPLKIWVVKIFLIALLVPFQHWMEHGLTYFLASRRLVKMRSRISVKRLWENMRKPAPDIENTIEEDTAVL